MRKIKKSFKPAHCNPYKPTALQKKRNNFEEKHFDQTHNKWELKSGPIIGAAELYEIPSGKYSLYDIFKIKKRDLKTRSKCLAVFNGCRAHFKIREKTPTRKFLVCEFPMELSITEKREWLAKANGHFKKYPHSFDLIKPKSHVISFSEVRAGHGTKSGERAIKETMVQFMKAQEEKLKQDPKFKIASDRREQIAKDVRQRYGRVYTPERIRRLI